MLMKNREGRYSLKDYETLALPLSYAGTRQFSIVRSMSGECQADERHFDDQRESNLGASETLRKRVRNS